MNIRKALNRAKKERRNDFRASLTDQNLINISDEDSGYNFNVDLPNKKSDSAYKESSNEDEWSAPVYNISKNIKLNRQILRKNRCISFFTEELENNAYKILRSRVLQQTKEKNIKTLMVTSSLPGEGKSLTSINLAINMAREFNKTILLVDCDLNQQKIHKYLGLKNDIGLIDYLKKEKSLKDLFIWPNIEKFTFISGGKTVEDSSVYLGSPKMKNLVTELKSRYDDRYIIFDTPPVLASPDSTTLTPLMDGILLVVESAKTSINDINRALEFIPKEKFLGFVLNRHKMKIEKNSY